MTFTTGNARPKSGTAQFKVDREHPKILPALRDRLWRYRSTGNFEGTIPEIHRYLSDVRQSSYDPVTNEVLLELHCAAASAFDQVDDQRQVQAFLEPFSAALYYIVQTILNDHRASGLSTATTLDLQAHSHLWWLRTWLVQRLGVQQYRLGNYSSNRYWRGIALLHHGRFADAQADFVESLQIMADKHAELERGIKTADAKRGAYLDRRDSYVLQYARYVTSRTLMGLGLLKLHCGELTEARTNLSTVQIMLARDSNDDLRRQRCQSLLLSVQQVALDNSQPDWASRGKEIILSLRLVAKALRKRHLVNFLRARETEALVHIRLADLYFEKMGQGGPDDPVRLNLQAALAIAEDNAGFSVGNVRELLQSRLLKLRVVSRQARLAWAGKGSPPGDDPIELGNILLSQRAISGFPLILADTKIALGNAYARRYRFGNSRNLPDLAIAEKLLLEARDMAGHNLQTLVLCSLYLARILVWRGNFDKAQFELERWGLTAERGSPWVRALRDEVQLELRALSTGKLVIDDSKLTGTGIYTAIHRDLRRFLLKQMPDGLSHKEIATKLGVSRQTVYTWQNELRDEEPNPR